MHDAQRLAFTITKQEGVLLRLGKAIRKFLGYKILNLNGQYRKNNNGVVKTYTFYISPYVWRS